MAVDRKAPLMLSGVSCGFSVERVTVRAGDGNLTRTISLGIRQNRATMGLTWQFNCPLLTVTDPFTGSNGPLMAH